MTKIAERQFCIPETPELTPGEMQCNAGLVDACEFFDGAQPGEHYQPFNEENARPFDDEDGAYLTIRDGFLRWHSRLEPSGYDTPNEVRHMARARGSAAVLADALELVCVEAESGLDAHCEVITRRRAEAAIALVRAFAKCIANGALGDLSIGPESHGERRGR